MKTKLIIFEGMDNTGKTFTINRLCKVLSYNNKTYIVIKADNPCPNAQYMTPDEVISQTKKYYNDFINRIITYDTTTDVIILDRSWLSEYVYGPLYRSRIKTDIVTDIMSYELKLHNVFEYIYLVTFVSNNYGFLTAQEDGNSLSNCDIKKLTNEYNQFTEIHEYSLIPIKSIYNVCNIHHNSYKEIFPDIMKELIEII